MGERTFALITRNNTKLLNKKSLKKNKNAIQLPSKIKKKRGNKTLGATPQQGDLFFALAEEVEHPWLWD